MYFALSGLEDVLGQDTQGGALGYHIWPFQGQEKRTKKPGGPCGVARFWF